MPATPRRARNFGGSSQHQKLMMANLAASLFAAEGIVTTEAKAKRLRPLAERLFDERTRLPAGTPGEPLCFDPGAAVGRDDDLDDLHRVYAPTWMESLIEPAPS